MYRIIKIKERPDLINQAAKWFSEKWHIPSDTYKESMLDSLHSNIPSWYAVMDKEDIIAGCGVIENDFHNRKDLTPNICAVYVEEAYRNKGIAGEMLNYVASDLNKEMDYLYLLTDHIGFYEKYGYEFLCMALGDFDDEPSRMYVKKIKEDV